MKSGLYTGPGHYAANNRRSAKKPGSEREIPCDLFIIGHGFTCVELGALREIGFNLSARGAFWTTNNYQTEIARIFATGDAPLLCILLRKYLSHFSFTKVRKIVNSTGAVYRRCYGSRNAKNIYQ